MQTELTTSRATVVKRPPPTRLAWLACLVLLALPSLTQAQTTVVPDPPDPCTFGTRGADYGTIPSCHRIDDTRHLGGWQTLGWAYYCPDNVPFLANWRHTGDGVSVTYDPISSHPGSKGEGAKVDLTFTNWDPFASLPEKVAIACSPMPTNTTYDVGNPVPAPLIDSITPLPGGYEKLCSHDRDISACTYAEAFYAREGGNYELYYRVTVEGPAVPRVTWYHIGTYPVP